MRLLDRTLASRASPFIQFALLACREALADAGWMPSTEEQRTRTGVTIGSGMGSLEDVEQATVTLGTSGLRRISPFFVPRALVNLAAGNVSIEHGLKGPNTAPATACASGAHAIGDAANLIALGYADVMLAGGSEACITPVALAGFARAKALVTQFNDRPGQASRPFDTARDGFAMGEGAGILVLEEAGHAAARGARVYAELAGYGMSGDAHHITSPSETGDGALRAMRQAAARAGLQPCQIGYVNAHATSTPLGDAIEQRAIMDFANGSGGMGAVAPLLVSSSKGALGHLLGAAGGVEAVISVLALAHSLVPPTANLTELEVPAGMRRAEDGFTLQDARAQRGAGSRALSFNRTPVASAGLQAVLSNSFGFGGTNVSLCFRRVPSA